MLTSDLASFAKRTTPKNDLIQLLKHQQLDLVIPGSKYDAEAYIRRIRVELSRARTNMKLRGKHIPQFKTRLTLLNQAKKETYISLRITSVDNKFFSEIEQEMSKLLATVE